MTPEEIQQLTDEELMLAVAKVIVPEPWKHGLCEIYGQGELKYLCLKCSKKMSIAEVGEIMRESYCWASGYSGVRLTSTGCTVPTIPWCCLEQAAFAVRDYIYNKPQYVNWVKSIVQIAETLVVFASPRMWLESFLMVRENAKRSPGVCEDAKEIE